MRLARRGLTRIAITSLICLLAAPAAHADTPLARAFAAAWARQPAAAGLNERQRASQTRQAAASAWTAEAPSLEMAVRSDRFHRNQGAQEQEVGLVLPLWQPGERSASQSLAEAEASTVDPRSTALRLQLAQSLREAWWTWALASNEQALAGERQAAARQLRDDVARRYAAGDLSRADLNSANAALALAEGQTAESEAALAQARYRLLALSGPQALDDNATPEPVPATADAAPAENHPQWRDAAAQAARAEAEAELVRHQTRANPELIVSTRRDRAALDAATDQTVALALRLPFGGGPRHDAKLANAHAEALERRQEAVQQRERLALESEAARLQLAATRTALAAAERRAGLARENRALYEKSFRLGETDLPTRLRIEAERFEADRALNRARIALAQSISQWRQALGLLPE